MKTMEKTETCNECGRPITIKGLCRECFDKKRICEGVINGEKKILMTLMITKKTFDDLYRLSKALGHTRETVLETLIDLSFPQDCDIETEIEAILTLQNLVNAKLKERKHDKEKKAG